MELQQYEIAIKFELRSKITKWHGPQWFWSQLRNNVGRQFSTLAITTTTTNIQNVLSHDFRKDHIKNVSVSKPAHVVLILISILLETACLYYDFRK